MTQSNQPITQKFCHKCKETKDINSFGKDLRRPDKHFSYCKSCKANLARDVNERIRSGRRTQQNLYRKSAGGKRKNNENTKRMYKKYPEKMRARARLRYAVRMGRVLKPELCDNHVLSDLICKGILHAHHYQGYEGDNWKIVKWLCVSHHVKAHLGENRKYNL